MFETTASDGTDVQAFNEGSGPVILVVPPGMDDGSGYAKVAAALADRFRVLRLRRRQYRLDLPAPVTIPEEVRDIAAVVQAVGEPVLLFGHSSGAVVALEALVAMPDAFTGAVLYEPPVVTDLPLGEPGAEAAARAAVDAGKPGAALEIFVRDVVRIPPTAAWLTRAAVPFMPKYKALVPRQIDDLSSIIALGDRRDAYSAIDTRVLLLGGAKSPSHLGARLDALQRILPRCSRTVMESQGHTANAQGVDELAGIIARFAQTRD
jgi:pimeloyl-ACP methyl ester carboxylesterase